MGSGGREFRRRDGTSVVAPFIRSCWTLATGQKIRCSNRAQLGNSDWVSRRRWQRAVDRGDECVW